MTEGIRKEKALLLYGIIAKADRNKLLPGETLE